GQRPVAVEGKDAGVEFNERSRRGGERTAGKGSAAAERETAALHVDAAVVVEGHPAVGGIEIRRASAVGFGEAAAVVEDRRQSAAAIVKRRIVLGDEAAGVVEHTVAA